MFAFIVAIGRQCQQVIIIIQGSNIHKRLNRVKLKKVLSLPPGVIAIFIAVTMEKFLPQRLITYFLSDYI